jgi:hypothetical protein
VNSVALLNFASAFLSFVRASCDSSAISTQRLKGPLSRALLTFREYSEGIQGVFRGYEEV